MPRTDRAAPHLPDRYARRLQRIHAALDTLTAPCWIDDVLDHCADGLAFSIQLSNARDQLDDLLEDLGITAGNDRQDVEHDADGVLPEDSIGTHGKTLQAAHAAAAQGELPGLDMGQHHQAPENATRRPCASLGGISESAGEMQ
jgi:hypothetical protein